MKYRDYYQTLGVSRQSDAQEIKKAYRKLARKYHPDVSKEPHAEDKFKELGEAYEVLRDDEKRAAYDELGSNWQSGQDFQPPPGWQQPFQENSDPAGSTFGFDSFSELFGELYGHQKSGRGANGTDLHATLNLALQALVKQQPVDITLRDDRTGQVRTLRVKVPAHIRDGDTFRLKGQGLKSASGGQPGNLYVNVRFVPDPRFEIVGHDLHTKLRVSPWEAVLGAKVPVETIEGVVSLTIPPSSTAGKTLRLKGRGLPGARAGHQIVHLEIDVPADPTAEEKRHFATLAEISKFDARA